MKKIIVAIVFAGMANLALAVDMGAVVKAQVVLGQINQVVDKYKEVQDLLASGTVTLDVAEPVRGNKGRFMLPFDEAGNLTAWAEKALNAQAGAAGGGAVGEKATGAVLSKVPFGGFFAGAAKRKAKETGAVMAIGGWDFIKENTSLSFDNLRDYSVYLHSQFNGQPGYEKALAAAMAVYPKLEKSYKGYVDRAYKDAARQARRLEK